MRDVEKFIYHPNLFKSQLGVGEAVMIIPHEKGAATVKLKFSMLPDLPSCSIPDFDKPDAVGFEVNAEVASETNDVNKQLSTQPPAVDGDTDNPKTASTILGVLSILAFMFLSGCASKSKKTICDYESGRPNTRFLLIGSCVKTSRTITGFEWVETTVDDAKITQGHLVLQTSAVHKEGSK